MIIPFIADYTTRGDSTQFYVSHINGLKEIEVPYKKLDSYNNESVKFLYKIYEWIYEEKNTDRISITRNIMTISLCKQCLGSYYIILLDR